MAWRVLWMALAVSMLLIGTTSVARAGPMICVVRVGRPVDDAILKRVLGQTSDLPLSIVRVPEAIEPDEGAARSRADVLARSRGARAVVWFTLAGRSDIMIYVLDPEERRLFAHRVGQDAGSRSAMLEASSLIVRDVLQSLLEGRPIGHRFESRPRDQSDGSDVIAPPLLVGGELARAAPLALRTAPRRDSWTPFTAFGVRTMLSHSRPSLALNPRVGFEGGPFEAGLSLTLGAIDVRTDPVATLLLRRHSLGAFGGWRRNLGENLTVGVDVHAGLVLFFRSTRPLVSYLLASASTVNAHGYVGPEVRVTWAPPRSWARVAIGAGADFVFAPPAFRYEGTNGRSVRELALWPLQPYLTASVEFGAPR